MNNLIKLKINYKVRLLFILIFYLILLITPTILAYSMSPPDKVVHQHITNESKFVWTTVPDEIKNRLKVVT